MIKDRTDRNNSVPSNSLNRPDRLGSVIVNKYKLIGSMSRAVDICFQYLFPAATFSSSPAINIVIIFKFLSCPVTMLLLSQVKFKPKPVLSPRHFKCIPRGSNRSWNFQWSNWAEPHWASCFERSNQTKLISSYPDQFRSKSWHTGLRRWDNYHPFNVLIYMTLYIMTRILQNTGKNSWSERLITVGTKLALPIWSPPIIQQWWVIAV